jgi:Na+/H+ antiporter NhaD/arsenite permease-like protein
MHAALAAVIFAATLAAVIVRPRGVSEAWTAAAGAVLMLVTGAVVTSSARDRGRGWSLCDVDREVCGCRRPSRDR